MSLAALCTHDRRRFLRNGGLTLAALLTGTTKMFADFNGLIDGMMRAAKTDKVNVIPLGANLYVIENTGGNITVLDSKEGKLLIDAGIGGQHSQITAALSSISANPVKEVISTHWHFDHTGGNAWLHDDGARVTAHKNTKKHMVVPTTVTPWHYTFPPTPTSGLPTNLLEGGTSLTFNGVHIEATHVPHAHTDGDLVVFFPDLDVISAGDTFWNGYYPFIDCDTGGDIGGMINATKTNLVRSTDQTKIVPGHGPVGTRAQLQEYHDMLVSIRDAVMHHKRQDMTVEEVVAAKPTARFDAKWGNYAVSPDDFVRIVYNEVCCEQSDN
jgi:glyoxylase-like metal-dependent hydrolase (beta-lactamase superfamily II)